MTTICACADGQSTYIGSDLMATFEDLRMVHPPKWNVWNEWAVACCGSQITSDILHRQIKTIGPLLQDPFEFGQTLRAMLVDTYGYSPKTSDSHTMPRLGECEFLIAGPGVIHHMDDAFSTTAVGKFWAIGSGRRLALGAFATIDHAYTVGQRAEARDVVVAALQAASRFDVGTGPDQWVHQLDQTPKPIDA